MTRTTPSHDRRGSVQAASPLPNLKPLARRLKAKRSGTSMMAVSERVNQVKFTFSQVIAVAIQSLKGMTSRSG